MNAGRRKTAVNDADRVFSKSSVGYMRDSETPSSASTPNHAGTPTGSFAENNNKKKKKAPEEDDGRVTKRQKISFAPGRRREDD